MNGSKRGQTLRSTTEQLGAKRVDIAIGFRVARGKYDDLKV
jgi:hypothetical protein